MRPTTTLLKASLGSVFHATDVVRAAGRHDAVPEAPARPTFTVADVAHWHTPERSEYLLRTIAALRSQAGTVSVAIISNEPVPMLEGLGDLGPEIRRCVDRREMAEYLLSHPGALACTGWTPPRRRTHPFELTWAHKPFMHSIVFEHGGFSHGLTHLVHMENDMALAPGALDYWARARPVLEPSGLLPGFVRFEGRNGDRCITDQQRRVTLSTVVSTRAPLAPDDAADVLWVNLPNPHQGCIVLDGPLAVDHLRTSRFLSPARSLSGPPTWGRDLGLIERSAVGPLCEDVPPGYKTRNVVPLIVGQGRPRPLDACLIEHLPANYYLNEQSGFATIPLDDSFVDDRTTPAEAPPPAH